MSKLVNGKINLLSYFFEAMEYSFKTSKTTQKEVAKVAGITEQYFTAIKRGDRTPKEDIQRGIALAFGYEDLLDFLLLGRKIKNENEPQFINQKSNSSDELIEVYRENRELRKELDRYRLLEGRGAEVAPEETPAKGVA